MFYSLSVTNNTTLKVEKQSHMPKTTPNASPDKRIEKEASPRKSERALSVLFSHLPGVATLTSKVKRLSIKPSSTHEAMGPPKETNYKILEKKKFEDMFAKHTRKLDVSDGKIDAITKLFELQVEKVDNHEARIATLEVLAKRVNNK
jgi:hypothetical protein